MGSYEVLEHTADVGIRAEGADLGELFEQAALALADIEGARGSRPGARVTVALEAPDPGALLVDWLNELIYLLEGGGRLASVEVSSATERTLEAEIEIAAGTAEGLAVKAATYHRLKVERAGPGWMAEVYLDV
jgi:SHS2 domain-containing protein